MSDRNANGRRPIPPAPRQSLPYVFTLERRADPSAPYQAWAIALIDQGADGVALRIKSSDGTAHARVTRHPLEPGGAARFFFEDLPQLGRPGAEITRNTPSVFSVLTEIQQRFKMPGRAVYRGRSDRRSASDAVVEPVQSAADAEFDALAGGMLTTAETEIPQ